MSEATKSIDIITAEAAEWFALNREEVLTREQRGQFLAWLSASPLHIEEYLGVAQSWGAMQAVEALPELPDDGQLVAGSEAGNVYRLQAPVVRTHARGQMRPGRWRLLITSAAAVVLALGSVLAYTWGWTGGQSYQTGVGEQRSVVLRDGSIMQLNAMTRVRVRFDDGLRRIELADGEAYFKVAHDTARPFDVVTPEAVVRAVGTAFNVYRRAGKLDVAVTEGRVRVSAGRTTQAAAIDQPVFLSAREGVVMRGSGPLARTSAVETMPAPAWMQRRLVFHGERLDAVIAEFNRYTTERMQVVDAGLAGLRISGTFNADDPNTLIAYLEQIQSVKVDRAQGKTVLQWSRDPARQ